ncbi:hypothetical protein ACJIZ3_008623 [Penstemon smallii]|uniref:ER membrane protein complex subunit 10 n=1 Tax=Penstemon smallii TaxID=265156 RepID=A0ABD3TC16_9LAMI
MYGSRTPVFTEEVVGELGEGEEEKPLERSFRAKYWMYLIPLGFILMNAMTQATNMADEPSTGQPGSQTQQAAAGLLLTIIFSVNCRFGFMMKDR